VLLSCVPEIDPTSIQPNQLINWVFFKTYIIVHEMDDTKVDVLLSPRGRDSQLDHFMFYIFLWRMILGYLKTYLSVKSLITKKTPNQVRTSSTRPTC
jgi:hypothetical protein